jgi:hypothetical protein
MFNRRPKHKHDWNLIDKTIMPGRSSGFKLNGYDVDLEVLRKIIQGYVVLTFKCDCGEYRIEER